VKRVVAHSVVVAATRGTCWLLVRAGDARIYEGTLQPGQTVRFTQRPLWIRFGAPWNVDVRVDGAPRAFADGRQPVNLTF
jgi:hypothetical protein